MFWIEIMLSSRNMSTAPTRISIFHLHQLGSQRGPYPAVKLTPRLDPALDPYHSPANTHNSKRGAISTQVTRIRGIRDRPNTAYLYLSPVHQLWLVLIPSRLYWASSFRHLAHALLPVTLPSLIVRSRTRYLLAITTSNAQSILRCSSRTCQHCQPLLPTSSSTRIRNPKTRPLLRHLRHQ